MVASIFGIFAGFWLSYATLVLGLLHNWFVLPATDVTHTVAPFQITWLVIIVLLTLATLRLPWRSLWCSCSSTPRWPS